MTKNEKIVNISCEIGTICAEMRYGENDDAIDDAIRVASRLVRETDGSPDAYEILFRFRAIRAEIQRINRIARKLRAGGMK